MSAQPAPAPFGEFSALGAGTIFKLVKSQFSFAMRPTYKKLSDDYARLIDFPGEPDAYKGLMEFRGDVQVFIIKRPENG